ncbi:MAG: hybrid sensor histidine kinase/response regulator [Planctomycetes bacterium]|uniref:hybrid sensor histidine kinase/response regulator n=1 Tax=Candidatus Wunengus sp. YC65 TaxID=3367701 RepID=UPI001DCA415A|nr:hybrid sensor histidine kinase/response regulator [Planctomycetota bacterium]
MGKKETDFRKRLLSTFKVEAQDHLKTIISGLVGLEKTPPPDVQMEILETIYRGSHSLKGAARAVNLSDIETICQSVEGVFSLWKQKKISQSPELFDTLHHAIDTIRAILSSLEGGQPALEKDRIPKLIQALSNLEAGAIEKGEILLPTEEQELRTKLSFITTPQSPFSKEGQRGILETREYPLTTEHPASSETVRIPATKLGSLLLQAEEMLAVKHIVNQYAANLKDIAVMVDLCKTEASRTHLDIFKEQRESTGKNGGREKGLASSQAARLQEFFTWTQTHLKSLEGKLSAMTKSTMQYNKMLDRMVGNLHDDMKEAMLLPFSSLLEIFPMLVRNLSHEQGKEVDLVICGETIEIDRRILEEMKDPLIHLVRNSIGHGIEIPETRTSYKKPRRGAITMSTTHLDGNKVEILVSDDGTGIDVSKVKEAAVKERILSQMEADNLTEREALYLIFHSGISTSPMITDISGRGLGLAIVQEKVENLGGSISVKTAPYTGTTFRILLPLTVATFRGISVLVSDRVFLIPTTNVEKTIKIRNDEIKTVENRETITVNNRPVSFARLGRILELPYKKKRDEQTDSTTVLLLSVSGKRIAFGIDKILDEQEILVKNLGRQLARVRNIAGAAIMGTGKPVPILNVPDLIRSAVKAAGAPAMPAVAAEKAEAKRKAILVVEDSITSRILLKNILESAGYDVKTAVDGIDAITTLKTEHFDLVVSDIEMPRMNGFDLTLKIRSDKKLAELPVVLVTALEAREDRERGIDVGANAYIVKSSFNQSNLLEVVRRLI